MHSLAKRSLFSVLSAAVLFAGLTACTSSTSTTTSSSRPSQYPSNVRKNFLTSCEAQPGATSTTCSRCLAAVEKAFTYDEFVELDTAIRMGTATRADSDKLAGILADCA